MSSEFAEQEFGGAGLGDSRLDLRLVRMADAAQANPQASFPRMMKNDAELEATYRFLNNPRLTPEQILGPHVRQTAARCHKAARVWVAHDTTDLLFEGEAKRENLGRVRNQKQGFQAHVSIAVEPGNEARMMLGVLAIERINDKPKVQRGQSNRPVNGELSIWLQGVQAAESALHEDTEVIHLMDRGSDSYELWARLQSRGSHFVCRLSNNRKLKDSVKLFALLDDNTGLPARMERTVILSRRGKEKGSTLRKVHPPRDRRKALLEIRSCTIEIPRPDYCAKLDIAKTLSLSVVHVREVDTPDGCKPVDWKLISTEPIETPEQVEEIVDAYRGRWVIEEYFKTLKTGCAMEKRQLASYEGLAMALALLAPVAWRLLRLRSLPMTNPQHPATEVLTDLQLRILRVKARDPFPKHATVADACFAVARLGGFLKHNKRPGWQILWRGMEKLLLMEEGAALLAVEM